MTTLARFESKTWPGSGTDRINEDYALIDESACCAVLVDGATGLTKANLVPGTSDAAWYARELVTRTVRNLQDPSMPTVTALAQAGTAVANEYLQLPGADALKREDLPNGSAAVLRWTTDDLEVVMLGDCTATVTLRDDTVCVVHDPTLDELDRQNYERMYQYALQNDTTMACARSAMNDRFIENRLKMNEPGGYWAADVTCRGFGHELVERFPLSQVAGVFACSDGFAAAVDMGIAASTEELGCRTLAGEGAELAALLRKAELEDKDLWRVHRSKISDDTTYMAIAFA